MLQFKKKYHKNVVQTVFTIVLVFEVFLTQAVVELLKKVIVSRLEISEYAG